MNAITTGAAVVTGAGRGLGREIARLLHARGLTVHVTDIDGEAAEAVAAELGDRAWSSALDVSDAEACRTVARRSVERAGALAVWCNNAGVLHTGVSWEHDEAARRLMLDVNAHGTMNGTIAALEHMRPADQGHVLNIVSLAGLVAAPGEVVYAASKHAAIAFSIGTLADLRRTGSRGVHISCVCPDGIWTPMLFDELDNPETAASFQGVLLSPEHVARRAVTLLDRPRPVLTIPRHRGLVVRLFDAAPALAVRLVPHVMADARRRQRRLAKRRARGEDVRPRR